MVVWEIKLYELLEAKTREKEAEAFIEILENKVVVRHPIWTQRYC